MVKIGLIGVGKWGMNHLRNLSELDCDLVGIADPNPDVEKLAKENGVKYFKDYKDLFPLVDAVSVVVPTTLHYQVVKDALKENKHVFVEKPVTPEAKQTEELVEMAKSKKLILAVGYLFRFNASVKRLKELMPKIGKLQYIESRYIHSTKPPRTDSGVVLNLGIHMIDILNYILETRPNKVYCKKINLLDNTLEDSAKIMLDYGDFYSSIETSCCHPEKKRDMWIIAEKEKLYIDFLEQKITRYPLIVNYKEVVRDTEYNEDLQPNEPLKEELIHFLSNIKNHNPEKYEKIMNIGKEEYYTTKICELALKSAEFNRDLDIPNNH